MIDKLISRINYDNILESICKFKKSSEEYSENSYSTIQLLKTIDSLKDCFLEISEELKPIAPLDKLCLRRYGYYFCFMGAYSREFYFNGENFMERLNQGAVYFDLVFDEIPGKRYLDLNLDPNSFNPRRNLIDHVNLFKAIGSETRRNISQSYRDIYENAPEFNYYESYAKENYITSEAILNDVGNLVKIKKKNNLTEQLITSRSKLTKTGVLIGEVKK